MSSSQGRAGGSQPYAGQQTTGQQTTGQQPAGQQPAGQPYQGQEYRYGQGGYDPMERQSGAGAVAGSMLAGVLMILSGLYGFLTGLAMVVRGGFFTFHNGYAYHWDTTSWGWLELSLGAVVFAAGVCVMLGMVWARVVGVILATMSAVAAFLTIPYYPFFSIILVAVNVFIIWALIARRRDVAV